MVLAAVCRGTPRCCPRTRETAGRGRKRPKAKAGSVMDLNAGRFQKRHPRCFLLETTSTLVSCDQIGCHHPGCLSTGICGHRPCSDSARPRAPRGKSLLRSPVGPGVDSPTRSVSILCAALSVHGPPSPLRGGGGADGRHAFTGILLSSHLFQLSARNRSAIGHAERAVLATFNTKPV